LSGYVGNAFVQCDLPPPPPTPTRAQPCVPNPCGSNARCEERNSAGACVCNKDYFGDPYVGCQPECTVNNDCPSHLACMNFKCKNPCVGACGANAICSVRNHYANCVCETGYTGNPQVGCSRIPPPTPAPRPNIKVDPCSVTDCGPYSTCSSRGDYASCSCLPTYFGSPPRCRPECVIDQDCPSNRACRGQKCISLCPGNCGRNAECQTIQHRLECTCKSI
jgi:hypothetical protein